jgi:hypothetical protein
MKALLYSLAILATLTASVDASLPGLTLQRLMPPARADRTNGYFGEHSAINERWAVVSERTQAGAAVHVYSATTGAYARSLRIAAASQVTSLSLQGDLLLVGDVAGMPGEAHLFSLTNGARLRSFTPPVPDNAYGQEVLLHHNRVLIATPTADRVDVFDINGPWQRAVLGTMGSRFGTVLHSFRGVVCVGTPGSGAGSGSYVFLKPDTGTLQTPLGPPNFGPAWGSAIAGQTGQLWIANGDGKVRGASAFGGDMGQSLAGTLIRGNAIVNDSQLLAVVEQAGNIKFFDTTTLMNEPIRTITPPEIGCVKITGLSLAMGRMLVCASEDMYRNSTNAGEVFLISRLPQGSSMKGFAMQGGWLDDIGNATLNSMHEAVQTPAGKVSLVSSLAGPDSAKGADHALWVNVGETVETLISRSRDDQGGGVRVVRPSNLIWNSATRGLFKLTLTGTGITSFNNTAWVQMDPSGMGFTFLRNGTDIGGTGDDILSIPAMSAGTTGQAAAALLFRQGFNGVTATTDSGAKMFVLGSLVTPLTRREGGTDVQGDTFGQFTPRIAMSNDRAVFTAAATGNAITSANNAKVHRYAYLMADDVVAQKSVVFASGLAPSAFIGETIRGDGDIYVRASLASDVAGSLTSANNEAILGQRAGVKSVIARKGSSILGDGKVITRILAFAGCASSFSNDGFIIHAMISGPGITSASNEAVYLWDGTAWTKLVQKGDLAPGGHGATIKSISQLTAHDGGSYTFLSTLGGTATSATNLALFGGSAAAFSGSADKPHCYQPLMVLRKGMLVTTSPGVSAAITTLAIAHTGCFDATGALNKGLANPTVTNGATSSTLAKIGLAGAKPVIVRVQIPHG